MDSFCIKLNDLRFFSKIGVFSQERVVGNEFKVDCHLEYDASGFIPEDLDSTISYAEIYELIAAEMKKESLLLETVAKRIFDTLRTHWPEIYEGSVEITKLSPPIAGISGNCSVKYFYKKEG